MAGLKRRYKLRGEDGRIRTVTAQSYQGAKRAFAKDFQAPVGYHLVVWPMGDGDRKRNMRVTANDLK